MTRWKRGGILVVEYRYDHPPRHVHVFEDGRRCLKFDLENWRVLEGRLTPRVRKILQDLRAEGAFNAQPKV